MSHDIQITILNKYNKVDTKHRLNILVNFVIGF